MKKMPMTGWVVYNLTDNTFSEGGHGFSPDFQKAKTFRTERDAQLVLDYVKDIYRNTCDLELQKYTLTLTPVAWVRKPSKATVVR